MENETARALNAPLTADEFTSLMAIGAGTPITADHAAKLVELELASQEADKLALTEFGRARLQHGK